mmetsp:Transcript_19995/g.29428  ORF Transcript_19995/g.29428 Transcript_19995/m.29428 type:complete len:170 (-) Transcript_19995:160-669(-)
MKQTLFLLAAFAITISDAFTSRSRLVPNVFARTSTTSLNMAGPLIKGKDYENVVQGIMNTKGMTREEAEKDYNTYLENPNNYALMKGEQYYMDLGYNSLMEGVIGEAEKKGEGDAVKARIEAFKKKSQLKAYAVITVALSAFIYGKIQYDADPNSLTQMAIQAQQQILL